MKTRTNHGSSVDLFRPERQLFNEPVSYFEKGWQYWQYRSGGFDGSTGSYGRAGTLQDAQRILINLRQRQP